MDFRSKSILPPKDWKTFEELCHRLFKKIWNDPYAQMHGRSGQAQHGVDIYGSPAGDRNIFWGVQCKGKDQLYGKSATLSELELEISKAEGFKPALEKWFFVTSAPNDSKLQEAARMLTQERLNSGKFSVEVMGWEELLALISMHPDIISDYYPEQAFDFGGFLKNLNQQLRGTPNNLILIDGVTLAGRVRGWEAIAFSNGRGLGPALLGRPLGPADASACPRLFETDVIVSQLDLAYSCRVEGAPGSGKSVCAYQAALDFVRRGFSVVSLSTPSLETKLNFLEDEKPVLYIIDDAHLLDQNILKSFEGLANVNQRIISTHTTLDFGNTYRGAIALDSKRAVKTIASALLRDRNTTLVAVQNADKDVGDRFLDISIEDRIEEAENHAFQPWQFCFVLGGGWRRAQQAVDNARLANADVVLAAAALRQLASRDARASAKDVIELIDTDNPYHQSAQTAISWLVDNRILLSADDCRCPHQRFSAVVLKHVIAGQDEINRKLIFKCYEKIIRDSTFPFAGLRILLQELRLGHSKYRWNSYFDTELFDDLVCRCWTSNGDDRLFATLLLCEISYFREGWINVSIRPNYRILSEWISNPGSSGYGCAELVNYIYSIDAPLAQQVVCESDAGSLAAALSNATTQNCYGLSKLTERAGFVGPTDWKSNFFKSLQKDKVIAMAETWSPNDAFYISEICVALAHFDDDFTLLFVEKFTPTLQLLITLDPITGFRAFDDVASHILNISDLFGIYVGKRRPSMRKRLLARQICLGIDSKLVATQLSDIKKRDFQTGAYFFDFLVRSSPGKYDKITQLLDWDKISDEIGDDWKSLSHEAEILIGSLSASSKSNELVVKMIVKNQLLIKKFPLRLSVIAPEIAWDYGLKGGEFGITKGHTVDFYFGSFFIDLFGRRDPDLLGKILDKDQQNIAIALSATHHSSYSDVYQFVVKLGQFAPNSLRSIIENVDFERAESGWSDCLHHGGDERKTIIILVNLATGIEGKARQFGLMLQSRFVKIFDKELRKS